MEDPFEGSGFIRHHSIDIDQKAIAMSQSGEGQVADSFDLCVAHANSRFCFLNLEQFTGRPIGADTVRPSAADPRLVGVLPIAWKLAYGTTNELGAPQAYVPIQKLTPLELQQLEAFDFVEIDDAERIGLGGAGVPVTLFRTAFLRPGSPPTSLRSLFDIDLDSKSRRVDTRVRDLDQDGDQTLDFVDDGLPGPISDDGILCGSGIPGDPLQDAQQTDFDGAQDALLAASGISLPARSLS